MDRSKTDMLEIFADLGAIVWSKKGGKNRLHFKLADGRECFSLHKTVIATLSSDRATLYLNDGGWPTPTTRSAMSDAVSAFNLSHSVSVHGDKGENVARFFPVGTWKDARTVRFARSAAIDVATWTPIAAPPDHVMIRAMLDDDGDGAEVRFTGKAIESSTGEKIPCDARRALKLLRELDRMARAAAHTLTCRGQSIDSLSRELAGYYCGPGSFGSTIHLGCHVFKTRDVRVAMRAIKESNPEAWKAAIACERKAAAKAKKESGK